MPRWLWVGATVVVVAVVLVLALAYVFQRKLIYLPSDGPVPPAAQVLPGARDVRLTTSDGLELGAWYAPPTGPGPGFTVLVANGNGGDRSHRTELAAALRAEGLSVLLFDYRGYGGNPGDPSAGGLALDVRAARDHLVGELGVPQDRLVYFGDSLGGAVVAELAREHPPAGLLLRSPFTELADTAAEHYPFLPVRMLLRDRLPVAGHVAHLDVPTVVVYGSADSVVPPAQSRAVADAAAGPVRVVEIRGGAPNDPGRRARARGGGGGGGQVKTGRGWSARWSNWSTRVADLQLLAVGVGGAALGLVKPAPDPVGLVDGQRVVAALDDHRAAPADLLGPRDPLLPRLPALGPRVEEHVAVLSAAGSQPLPVPRFGDRTGQPGDVHHGWLLHTFALDLFAEVVPGCFGTQTSHGRKWWTGASWLERGHHDHDATARWRAVEVARPIWSGAINFGLVTIPVELYSATEDHTISFRQFERGTSDRIRYKRINERTGKEVAFSDIVKGADVGGGEYVIIEPEELDQIAPGRSRTIDINSFVDLEEIDPIHFQKTYWLAPAKDEYGRSYSLLLQAMEKTNRAGIASFVMRGKEYLTAVRAGDGLLVLNTLLFPEDIRDPAKELKSLPEITSARGKELDMAVNLIESMADEWRPEEYHDTYTEQVEKLIDSKREGKEIVAEAEPSEPTKVVDLFEALSRSVETRKKGRSPAAPKASDLDDMSKADLDKLAKELDIKGRSKMNRDELAKAVADAQSTAAAS